jgi:WD40 repeat protein
VKFNHIGNRVAVSSIDYALQVYNMHPEGGLTHFKEIGGNTFDIWKVDFNPNSNEILSG